MGELICVVEVETKLFQSRVVNKQDRCDMIRDRLSEKTSFGAIGVWLILGTKTGLWSPHFLLTIATTLAIFTVLLAVVVLIGVIWESTALSTMVT